MARPPTFRFRPSSFPTASFALARDPPRSLSGRRDPRAGEESRVRRGRGEPPARTRLPIRGTRESVPTPRSPASPRMSREIRSVPSGAMHEERFGTGRTPRTRDSPAGSPVRRVLRAARSPWQEGGFLGLQKSFQNNEEHRFEGTESPTLRGGRGGTRRSLLRPPRCRRRRGEEGELLLPQTLRAARPTRGPLPFSPPGARGRRGGIRFRPDRQAPSLGSARQAGEESLRRQGGRLEFRRGGLRRGGERRGAAPRLRPLREAEAVEGPPARSQAQARAPGGSARRSAR